MITINDNESPIIAATKIIDGIEEEPGLLGRRDMFSIKELEELAEYILVYCKHNKEQ